MDIQFGFQVVETAISQPDQVQSGDNKATALLQWLFRTLITMDFQF